MDQHQGILVAQPNSSVWQRYWHEHRKLVILISCLLLPIVFVPLWIILVLVERHKKVAVTPEQNVASAEERNKLPSPTEIASSVGGLTFFGVLTIVGGCSCYLGFDVMGRADGPGGGIAYIMGVLLFVGGLGITVSGLIGLVPRIKSLT